MVTEMDYEKGYVFDLMEQGGPTDVNECYNTGRINTNVYASFFYLKNILTRCQKMIIIHIDTKSE